MILIHDGYMIDPKSGREGNYDILIDGDKIVKIAEKIEPRGKVTRINAEGLLVAPGLVDVHVHFRDPGFTAKEDINTGAAAAAKGGVTTVVLMANTKPAVDSEETLHYILDKGAKTGIHVTTCANVTMGMQGKQLTDMKKLAVAGAVGFTDDGVPLLDAELVRRAMEISAELDMPISFHEEDPKYIENNGVNRGKASEYYGIGGSARDRAGGAGPEAGRRDRSLHRHSAYQQQGSGGAGASGQKALLQYPRGSHSSSFYPD